MTTPNPAALTALYEVCKELVARKEEATGTPGYAGTDGRYERARSALSLAESPAKAEGKWLVYSREHNAWWGPNHCGYFTNVEDAGRYLHADASAIVKSASRGRGACGDSGPPEFMVPDFHTKPDAALVEAARKIHHSLCVEGRHSPMPIDEMANDLYANYKTCELPSELVSDLLSALSAHDANGGG